MAIDVTRIRQDFPILFRKVNGNPLIYLDNAATSQKPQSVIDGIKYFYENLNANPMRSIHYLAEKATEAYTEAREKVARFINASPEEIVFVRNATEAINLVSFSFPFKSGDVVSTTYLEHHSNLLPWLNLSRFGVKTDIADTDANFDLNMDYYRALPSGTRMVAVTHQSNVTGTINDVKTITRLAHEHGAHVLIDAAQSVPHMPVDVKDIGCDFLGFSVVGTTPVLAKKSDKIALMQIRDIVHLYKNGEDISVLTSNDEGEVHFERVSGSLTHNEKLYEIRYENSDLPVLATAYHSIYVWRNGKIVPIKVSDAKKGDYLITFNKQESLTNKDTVEVRVNYQHQHKQIEEKITVGRRLMRLIGYYLAEGSLDANDNRISLTFSEKETDYVKDVASLIEELEPMLFYNEVYETVNNFRGNSFRSIATTVGIDPGTVKKYLSGSTSIGLANLKRIRPRIYHNPVNHTLNIVFNSSKWYAFFSAFCGRKINKHLPSFTWSLGKRAVLELVLGYLRGDASKTEKYRLRVRSVSKNLITELAWVLKLNGISAILEFNKQKNRKWHDTYSLVIQRSELGDLSEFHVSIRKQDAPKDKLLCADGLRIAYDLAKPKFKAKIHSLVRNKEKRLTRKGVLEVIDWIQTTHKLPLTKRINDILNHYRIMAVGDLGLVKIKKIQRLNKRRVYDISVENTERFFGGDYPILLHNSGHKMLGPMGIGVLYMKKEASAILRPFLTGGEMINSVKIGDIRYAETPALFEAGTQNVEGAYGLGLAVDYLNSVGMGEIERYEKDLTDYLYSGLKDIKGVSVYSGKSRVRGPILSLNVEGLHSHDVAFLLDKKGIAIRSGFHCAQPFIEDKLGSKGTARASLYLYNTKEEVDAFVSAVKEISSKYG